MEMRYVVGMFECKNKYWLIWCELFEYFLASIKPVFSHSYMLHIHVAHVSSYVAGIDRIQDYYDSTTGWSYLEELYKFVDNGMEDDAFIDAVSNIAARGCHIYPCSKTPAIDTDRFLYGLERKINVKNIIKVNILLHNGLHSP